MNDDFDEGWTEGFDAGIQEGTLATEDRLRDAFREDLILSDILRQLLLQGEFNIEALPQIGGDYLTLEASIPLERHEVAVIVKVLNDNEG